MLGIYYLSCNEIAFFDNSLQVFWVMGRRFCVSWAIVARDGQGVVGRIRFTLFNFAPTGG